MMKMLSQATKNTGILITPVSADSQVEVPHRERQAEETGSYHPPCLAPARDITLQKQASITVPISWTVAQRFSKGRANEEDESFSCLTQGNFIWSKTQRIPYIMVLLKTMEILIESNLVGAGGFMILLVISKIAELSEV